MLVPSQVVARNPTTETTIGNACPATPDGNAVGFALEEGVLLRQHRRRQRGLGRMVPSYVTPTALATLPGSWRGYDLLTGSLEPPGDLHRGFWRHR